jgi:hypothetical protein
MLFLRGGTADTPFVTFYYRNAIHLYICNGCIPIFLWAGQAREFSLPKYQILQK